MDNLLQTVEKLSPSSLFIFDLDYTLWPFWCDTHVTPPFKLNHKRLIDRHGFEIKTYQDVSKILNTLHDCQIPIAAASRTEAPNVAEELLNLLDLNKFFTYKEIYKGTKLRHFEKLKKKTSLEYSDMIFYDDEMRNIKEIRALGVTVQYVEDGLNGKNFIQGIQKFHEQQQIHI